MDRSGGVRARRARPRPDIAIAAVGFDFDHTLGIDNKLERVAFLRLLTLACANGGRCLGSLAEEIQSIDTLLARQRSGAFTIEEAVETFMRDRGAPEPASFPERYKRMTLEMVEFFVVPEPGIAEMLGVLRGRRIPYAILTNGWSPLQQRKAEQVGFDGPVIVSADIGVQKPQAAAFDALTRALGARAPEIAFVGDTPESDVAGSLNAGMQGIWFDSEDAAYPKELPAPSAVIHSLTELSTLV